MVYAMFRYSLNVLFCEPTENYEYKRKLYMYHVTKFRTMLMFTTVIMGLKRKPGLRSSNPTGIGIRHTANGAPMCAEFHYRFNNMPILSDISLNLSYTTVNMVTRDKITM